MLQIFILFAVASIILGILERLRAPKRKEEGRIGEAENEILRNEYMRKQAESLKCSTTALEQAKQDRLEEDRNAKQNAAIPKLIYEAERSKPEVKQQPMRNVTTEPKMGSAAKPKLDPYSFPSEGKPLVAHSSADCTGGSIHDGYHEGTARKPIEAAQREGTIGKQGRKLKGRSEVHEQGVPMPGENHSVRYAPETVPVKPSKPSAHVGADKLVAAIAKKPSIVQGIIWSEVIGKPKSEIG